MRIPSDGRMTMPSAEHEQMVAALTAGGALTAPTLAEQRVSMEALMTAFPLAVDVQVEETSADGVAADWVTVPGSRHDRVVLYLHGGGYVLGSRKSHRELAARIARDAAARVLVIEYRLAPEHPYPAAVEDAVASYRWLLAQGLAADRIAVAGDSAGGGLTVATLVALNQQRLAQPACAVVMSPWIDLAGTGTSAQPGGADDPLLTLEGLRNMGQVYAGARCQEPLASPLYADLQHLPPLLIQVGTREVLLDDALRLASRAKLAGVMVDLQVEEGLIHVWQAFGPNLPEAVSAVRQIGQFIRRWIA